MASMILRRDNRFVIFTDSEGIHAWEPETGKVLPIDSIPARALSFLDDAQELLCTQNKEGDAGGVRWLQTGLPEISAKASDPLNSGGDAKDGFNLVTSKSIDARNNRDMGLSDDGRYLCVLRQRDITIFDTETGRLMKTFSVEGWPTAFAFGKDKELYLATREGKLEVWDWVMGERLQDFDTNDVKLGPISSMVVTPDRKQLILTTNSPMVTFLDIGKKILAKRLSPRPDDPCQQAILYPDGKHILLVYPTLKNRFCVWDLRNNEESFTLGEIAAKNVHLLGISPNGKWVVGYQEAERGPVYVWDATTGKLMPPISSINTFLVWGGFSAGGNNITFWEFAGRRSVIQLDERKVIQSGNPKTHPYRAAFSSTGNLVVSLDTTGLLVSEHMEKDDSPPAEIAAVVPRKVETPASGFLKSSVELSDTIGGSRYSSDGKIIFVCTHKGILHLLEATTLEEIAQYRISKNKLLEMVHTAKHAATTTTIPERLYLLDSRRRVYQWDTNLGKTTDEFVFDKMLPNPNQTSYHLVVPPDGSSLVFTSNGNQPHLWSMRAKKETLTPPPWTWMRPPITFSSKNLHRVVFSADEKVGTACAESKLYTWTVPAGGGKSLPIDRFQDDTGLARLDSGHVGTGGCRVQQTRGLELHYGKTSLVGGDSRKYGHHGSGRNPEKQRLCHDWRRQHDPGVGLSDW